MPPISSRRLRALVHFAARHRWSLPLALGSALFFAHWADEMREHELGPFDVAVAGAVAGLRGKWDASMLFFTRFGEGESMFVLVVLSAALLLALHRRREATFLVTVGAGASLLDVLLKLAFARARPGADALYLLHSPSSFSFPSGHALGSTTVLFSLVVVAKVTGVRGVWLLLLAGVAACLVLAVSVSRVYFGVHFPSDVIGGMCAGAAWVSAVSGWFYPRLLPGEEAPPAEVA